MNFPFMVVEALHTIATVIPLSYSFIYYIKRKQLKNMHKFENMLFKNDLMVSLILNILLLLLLILYMYRIALLLTNLRQRKSGCNDADERSFF